MSLLHLVRHGQASAGTDNYDRLSPTGEEQSRILGAWWQSHGFVPDKAFHGTLVRQRDTAAHALGELSDTDTVTPASADPGLNEYDHRIIEEHFAPAHTDYAPEAMTFSDYFEIIDRWRNHKPAGDDVNAHIELWSDFKARGWRTLQTLSSDGADNSNTVFFTSGGVIATILSTVLNLDFEHTVDAIWRIRNSSVTTLKVVNGKARLVDFNAVPHLQEQRKPELITLI